MPVAQVSSPYTRHKTRTPGVFYRLRADGKSRSYIVSLGNGKYVSAGTTEKEALAVQAKLRDRKASGEQIVVNDKTTFAQLAEEWYEAKSRRLRPRTASYYRTTLDTVLIPRFGSYRLGAISAEAIAEFIRELEDEGLHCIDRKRPTRPLGRSSIDNYLKPLQGTLKLAKRRKLIHDNPFADLTDDDRPQADEKTHAHEWTEVEVAALIAASEARAAKPESRYDYTPLIRLTVLQGLRIGEVLGLRWEDFDKAEGTLRVERQWLRTGEYGPPKTAAGNRVIVLADEARKLLLDLRMASSHSQDGDPIFVSQVGTPLSHRNVTRRGFEPVAEAAGLDVTFHGLRHAAASRLIAGNVDDALVADQLGHEDSTVTRKVYAHVYDRRAKAAGVREALAASLAK